MSEPTALKDLLPPQEPVICPICRKDKGYRYSFTTREYIPIEDCPNCKRKLEEERKAIDLKMNIAGYLQDCNVSVHYTNMPIELGHDCIAPIIDAVNGRSLYMWGGVGVGKTTRAVYILREKLLQQIVDKDDALFFSTIELCEYIRGGMDVGGGEYDRRLRNVAKKKFLVLDDIVAERDTPNNKDIITNIITTRYEFRRQTIITSNYSPYDAMRHYGKRIGSRFSAMLELKIEGTDRRKKEDKW